MTTLPLTPRLRHYRGSKENLRRQAAEFNAVAHKVVEHVNTLIANNPEEVQQYLFAYIAIDLGVPVEQVRDAIPYGGHNGITIGVRDDDREKMKRYKRVS